MISAPPPTSPSGDMPVPPDRSASADSGVSEPAFEPLHPAARWSTLIATLIGYCALYVPITTVALVVWNPSDVSSGGKFALFLLGLACVIVLAWVYSGARHRATRFALNDEGLRIRRGVFWQSEVLVPRSRVQHTDLSRGPLDRRFGMATLKVYTAGSKLASVGLDGIPEARALALRDALVNDDDDAV